MAKWDYELAGNSCHIHASLWDKAGKKPLFQDAKAEHGMSKLMRQFVAGQLKYADDITYFLAPYINSYKRFQAGTFAPTRTVVIAEIPQCGMGQSLRKVGHGSRAAK